jgi:hypothetical protein
MISVQIAPQARRSDGQTAIVAAGPGTGVSFTVVLSAGVSDGIGVAGDGVPGGTEGVTSVGIGAGVVTGGVPDGGIPVNPGYVSIRKIPARTMMTNAARAMILTVRFGSGDDAAEGDAGSGREFPQVVQNF